MLGVHMDARDSIARNVEQWTKNNREALDARAAAAWAGAEVTWGIFGVADADLGSPLGDVRGLDVVELGCGTAYVSAILTKRGARPVGVDPTPAQLATARRMRPEGRLVFLTNSVLAILCAPDTGDVTERLARPQRGMYRYEWPDEIGVELHLAHGEWIDLLRENGFEVERLVEVYARGDSKRHDYYGFIDPAWARAWPAEDLWCARKRG